MRRLVSSGSQQTPETAKSYRMHSQQRHDQRATPPFIARCSQDVSQLLPSHHHMHQTPREAKGVNHVMYLRIKASKERLITTYSHADHICKLYASLLTTKRRRHTVIHANKHPKHSPLLSTRLMAL